MKAKVPRAPKSYRVALVLWPTRVPSWSMHAALSASFMAQLVPSLRCHSCSVPSSIL